MALLTLFTVLLAAMSPGSAIQCRTCTAVNAECVGSLKNCSSESDSCGLIFTEATLSGMTVKTTRRSCKTQEGCIPGDFFMELENGYREAGSSVCCTMDDCNTGNFSVPVWNETLNGQQCPSCSAEYPKTCEPETMKCTGAATSCFTRLLGSVKQQGCATMSFCPNSFRVAIGEDSHALLFSQSIMCEIKNAVLESTPCYFTTFAAGLIAKTLLEFVFNA